MNPLPIPSRRGPGHVNPWRNPVRPYGRKGYNYPAVGIIVINPSVGEQARAQYVAPFWSCEWAKSTAIRISRHTLSLLHPPARVRVRTVARPLCVCVNRPSLEITNIYPVIPRASFDTRSHFSSCLCIPTHAFFGPMDAALSPAVQSTERQCTIHSTKIPVASPPQGVKSNHVQIELWTYIHIYIYIYYSLKMVQIHVYFFHLFLCGCNYYCCTCVVTLVHQHYSGRSSCIRMPTVERYL